jgi:AcrR family transcriptional regulator
MYGASMARPKEFNRDEALNAAIGVFREHGFEGTSAAMLTEEMKIGRQSLYDTFCDKWQLYRASLQRYASVETQAHIAARRSAPRAP